MSVHPTAHVDPSAELGRDVEVAPYASIGAGVMIGDRCRIGQGTVITGCARLGSHNVIYPYVILGTPPQDLKYHGEQTQLVIGDDNVFREFVTINTGTVTGEGATEIGNRNYFMIASHIGHDCVVQDDTILVNCVLVGGHCVLESGAKLMGAAAVNPFVSVGKQAYVGGLSRIVRDVPPFMIVEGNPARVRGVNEIGLSRAGYSQECIDELAEAYKTIYRTRELNRVRIFDEIESRDDACEEVGYLVRFLRLSLEGRHGRYREGQRGAH